jgi:hypothetical protein
VQNSRLDSLVAITDQWLTVAVLLMYLGLATPPTPPKVKRSSKKQQAVK